MGSTVDVFLKEDYHSLGYVGDKVKVRRGFARNYLVPRGMAIEASSPNARLLKHLVDGIQVKRLRLKSVALESKKKIEEITLEFKVKSSDKGKSFGAITAKDIEASLKEKGIEVDRKQIKIVEQIKRLGEYKIQIKLHSEVSASLPLRVIAEAAPKVEEKPAKKRAPSKKKAEKVEATDAADTQTENAEVAETNEIN